jgi:hypothetical protein
MVRFLRKAKTLLERGVEDREVAVPEPPKVVGPVLLHLINARHCYCYGLELSSI